MRAYASKMRKAFAAALLTAATVLPASADAEIEACGDSTFGSAALAGNIFKKETLAVKTADLAGRARQDLRDPWKRARLNQFFESLSDLSDADALTRLSETDRLVDSRLRFAPDDGDSWNTPAQTAIEGQGDCEDYAILKREALRRLGVAEEDMRILILEGEQDNHAVLAVRTPYGIFVLDNNSEEYGQGEIIPEQVYIGKKSGKSFIAACRAG